MGRMWTALKPGCDPKMGLRCISLKLLTCGYVRHLLVVRIAQNAVDFSVFKGVGSQILGDRRLAWDCSREMDLTREIESASWIFNPFCRKWFQVKPLWLNQNHRFLGSHPIRTVHRISNLTVKESPWTPIIIPNPC